MAKKLHLGFKKTQAKISKKQGISKKAAGAILANSARKASPAAVKKNPALLNVKRGIKKYGDGGLQKAKGQYLKAKGQSIKAKGQYIKAKGLEIKAKGQNMKPEVPKSIYKQSYSVAPVVKGAKEDDKMYERKQVLNKGSKTIVNRKSFEKMAEGYQTPMYKSTTIYDKKTGATKKSVSKLKYGGKNVNN
jgi:hypothetical protein